jgi:hypothetical protein
MTSAMRKTDADKKSSNRTLFEGLIDYAGLFPPAALEMTRAVRNYADYLQSEEAWMLGRFIVPGSRLAEFEEVADPFLPRGNPVQPWRISILSGQNLAADLNHLADFNYLHATDVNAGAAVVDTVELKAAKPDEIFRAMKLLPRTLASYFEIPITTDPTELVMALAQGGALAKVRTGGVTAGAFPSTADLARFITACADEKVPFKATAGLHHPLRGNYRLTDEADSESGMMFGFLNVFLAAAFARFGLNEDEVREVLEETSPEVFQFDEAGVNWRAHQLTLQRLDVARNQFAMTYGSCSFEEPVADLKKIGLL